MNKVYGRTIFTSFQACRPDSYLHLQKAFGKDGQISDHSGRRSASTLATPCPHNTRPLDFGLVYRMCTYHAHCRGVFRVRASTLSGPQLTALSEGTAAMWNGSQSFVFEILRMHAPDSGPGGSEAWLQNSQ